LDLTQNGIWHIQPLSALVHLVRLDLNNNKISDISALSGMVHLEWLNLHQNNLSDLAPLRGLTRLKEVHLYDNKIIDISPLSALTSLERLVLTGNPLGANAYRVDIPRIRSNNPGIVLLADPPTLVWLTLSSTAGGSVIDPGEGVFACTYGGVATLEAQPDPWSVFLRWSGSYVGTSNPATIVTDRDHQIRAHFVIVRDVLVVSADGPADPGPGDANTSDPSENGTDEHPFDSIQEAIEVAAEGATVLVRPGIYLESLDLLGKRIRLTGIDPNGMAYPVLVGAAGGPGVSFTRGEGPDCQLSGFILMQGQAGGAIACRGSSPTISNCLIVGNRSTDVRGAAVTCLESSARLVHCTIADNAGGLNGGGITLQDSDVAIVNSVVWGNHPHEIVLHGNSAARVTYSAVAGGWPGVGNIAEDPLFAQRGTWAAAADGAVVAPGNPNGVWIMGDYHPRSQGGRWDGASQIWVYDAMTSPCIDGGDPNAPVGYEPAPNGGVVNMGAYGGTPQASKSPSAGGEATIAMLPARPAGRQPS